MEQLQEEEEEENMFRQLYVANEGFFVNFSTISKNSANCFPEDLLYDDKS